MKYSDHNVSRIQDEAIQRKILLENELTLTVQAIETGASNLRKTVTLEVKKCKWMEEPVRNEKLQQIALKLTINCNHCGNRKHQSRKVDLILLLIHLEKSAIL